MSNSVPELKKTFFISLGDTFFQSEVKYFCKNYKNYNLVPQDFKIDQLKEKSLYRYPKINVPRTKLDLLKESHNIKVVRDPSKADYKVISDKYVESLFSLRWDKRYSAKDLYDYCISNPKDVCYRGSGTSILYLKKTVTSQSFQDFLKDNIDTYIVFPNAYAFFQHHGPTIDADYPEYEYKYYISEAHKALYEAILNDNTLIKDEQLVDFISSESGITLSREHYDSALTMIKSSDPEDITLALEMLANCNINKSLDYASMLFYFQYDRLKEASNWNSINVKALRQALDSFKPYYNSNAGGEYYHKYINTLAKQNFLTNFAIKEVSTLLFDDVVTRAVLGPDPINKNVLTIDPEAIKVSKDWVAKVRNTPIVNLDKLTF